MISSEFAPNENGGDAVLALGLLFQPWKWRRGKEMNNLKRRLKSRFFSSDCHISFFLSARGALYQYIKTLSFPADIKVLVSGFTPVTGLTPILGHKLIPVYVDIHEDDLSMNVQDLKKKYSDNARFLILRHPYGIVPKDRKQILAFARSKKMTVLEDVTQGFEPTLFKQKRFTTTILMSFSRSSAISSVLGGAIITRGKKSAEIMRDVEKNIPSASLVMIIQIILYKISSVVIKKTYHIHIGKLLHFMMKQFNLIPPAMTRKEMKGQFDSLYLKTYPNICGIFLMKQLDRFNDVLMKRKRSVVAYNKKISNSPFSDSALTFFPLITPNPLPLIKKLKQHNIILGNEQFTLQNGQINHHIYGYKTNRCPKCEQHIPKLVKLPTNISKIESQKLITTLKKVLHEKK